MIIYYSLILSICFLCAYFNDVFCGVYHGSQMNWFENSIVSIGVSLITTFGICGLITIIRYFGLKCKYEKAYNIK